jgi:hypothetical protein
MSFAILIFLTWFVLFSALVLVGLSFLHLLGTEEKMIQWDYAFWMGFSCLIVFLQLWNIFFPVGREALFFVCAGASFVFIRERSFIFKYFKTRTRFLWVLIFFIICGFIANRAIGQCLNPDSPLYHIPAVVWLAEFPLVPGWANIIPHFGFNSSYFLYVALFEVFTHQSHHFASGLFLSVIICTCVYSIHLFRSTQKQQIQISSVFYLLCIPVVLNEVFSENIASPSPDLPVFVLTFVLCGYFLRFLSEQNEKKRTVFLILIFVVSIVGCTIKLSFIAIGGLFLVLSIIVARRERVCLDPRLLCVISAFFFVSIGSWMYRGILTSGYPFFPSTLFALPLEWQVPEQNVIHLGKWVKSWARTPFVHHSVVLDSWQWFRPWLKTLFDRIQFLVPFLLSIVCLASLSVKRIRQRIPSTKRRYLLVLIPLCGNIIFWFFTAPDIRFINATFWCIALVLCSITFGDFIVRPKTAVCFFIFFCLIVIVRQERHCLRALVKGDFETAQAKYVQLLLTEKEHPPVVHFERFITESSLVLNVPGKDRHIWYGKIPATPFPDKGLYLRDENSMRLGFAVKTEN